MGRTSASGHLKEQSRGEVAERTREYGQDCQGHGDVVHGEDRRRCSLGAAEGNAASNVFKRRREKSPSEASGSSRSASSDSSEEERAKKSKDMKGKKDKDKKKDQKGKKKSKGDQERGDEKETGKKGKKGNKDKKDKDNKDQKDSKKGKKRARKGNKTDSDTDSSKSESDSSSVSQKSAKSKKSAESCKKDTHILKVRRAMQVGIFSDDDPIDEVELTTGESIKSAVCRLLGQLKIADAIGDFNVKARDHRDRRRRAEVEARGR